MLKDKHEIPPGANNVNQDQQPNPSERDGGNSDRDSRGQQTNEGRHGNNHPDEDNGNNSGYSDSKRITAKQHKYLLNLSLERGASKRELNNHCLKAFGVSVDYLSRADASGLIDQMLNQ
jgi:hypothetical protein